VVTDRLVEVLKDPKELEAVLLHEIGHVVHRHSMQQVIQSSALTVAVVMWTGDTTAVDGWVTALPTFLLQNKYSQDFETESDVFAFEHMIELGIDPAYFGSGLKRITSDAYKDDPEMKENMEKAEKVLEYFSSHPSTEDRDKLSKEYSERFKKGL
jgi:Zn-dependent protease with chaperone function